MDGASRPLGKPLQRRSRAGWFYSPSLASLKPAAQRFRVFEHKLPQAALFCNVLPGVIDGARCAPCLAVVGCILRTRAELFKAVAPEPWAHPQMIKSLVGRASAPAAGSANGARCAPYGKTIQGSHSWAFGPPVKHEKLVLAGGTAFPGCARLTCFLDTGWKACATNLKNFSK